MFRHCPGSSAMTLNGTVALNLLNILQTSKQTPITTQQHRLWRAIARLSHLSRRHTGGNNHFSYLSLAAMQGMQGLSYGAISRAKGWPPPRGTPPSRCNAHSPNVPAFDCRDPMLQCKQPNSGGISVPVHFESTRGRGEETGKVGRSCLWFFVPIPELWPLGQTSLANCVRHWLHLRRPV